MSVLNDINKAARAGERKRFQGAKAPAAKGRANTL